MTPYPYHLIGGENGRQSLTVFVGDEVIVVNDDHPGFDGLVSAAQSGLATERELLELADAGAAVERAFQKVSERVSVTGNDVLLDGDPQHGAIVSHILRALDADDLGGRAVVSLVNFMEKLATNPSEHSRTQLYEWLERRDFTITSEGDLIAYKGVTSDAKSIRSGPGVVNGQIVNGHLDNAVGNVIELARGEIDADSFVGCSTGLHVGTFDYASGFARGMIVKVRVNPRDVVSVPTDCEAAKVRVCRYEVLEVIDAPDTAPVVYANYDEDDYEVIDGEEDDFCGDCGVELDEGEDEVCSYCDPDY